jgi:hypothetical protein
MDDKERAKQILKYSERITALLKRKFPGGIPPKRFDVAFTPLKSPSSSRPLL